MRCLLLSASRAALFCVFMAILRVHALVVIPSAALPQTHPTLDADDALSASERGPPSWDWDLAPSHSPGQPPVSSTPTIMRLLPSHAPWYTQAETTAASLGHAPGTQRIFDDGTRGEDDKVPPRSSHRFPSWARANGREPDRRRRRQRPDGVDVDDAGAQYTSEDSKVSVLAVAVVGVVLACHYLDYL